jgi:hypothetical protein
MADVKISALSAIGTAANEDLVAIIDDPSGTPASRKATVAQLFLNRNLTGYLDFDIIAKPSDPSADDLRIYAKQIDANNDGLFYITQVGGAMTEVRI